MPLQIKSTSAVAVVTICISVLTAISGVRAANLLLENVTLIDGTGRAPMSGVSVLVKEDRISAVSRGRIPHESGVEIVDGTGKFLIPGLFDSHIHLQGAVIREGKPSFDHHLGVTALHSYLYSGVTSVYDSGNDPDYIFGLRGEERAGKIVSPRIFATGSVITVPNGYGANGGHAIVIADWNMARPQLDTYFKQRKPDLQKILIDRHGVFTPRNAVPSIEVLKNVVRLANENGIRTTVHAASEEDYEDALEGGVDNLAHVIRYPATDAIITRIATRRLISSTTLVVFDYIARIATDTSFLDTPLFRATVDPAIINAQKTVERQKYIESGMSAQSATLRVNIAANAKKIFDAGGLLAAGTDRTWGPALHMELDLLHKAGIPLLDVVRIATLNAAMYVGRERDLGSIEPGKLADMVLLTADPTQDVQNFQTIAAVFKGGERVNLSALDIPINKKSSPSGSDKQ